jgi:hypothetical protein
MQIDYYRECKIFRSDDDIRTIYNCLEKLVDHIEHRSKQAVSFRLSSHTKQATLGISFS